MPGSLDGYQVPLCPICGSAVAVHAVCALSDAPLPDEIRQTILDQEPHEIPQLLQPNPSPTPVVVIVALTGIFFPFLIYGLFRVWWKDGQIGTLAFSVLLAMIWAAILALTFWWWNHHQAELMYKASLIQRQAELRWMDLHYCAHDERIFLPANGRSEALHRIRYLLYDGLEGAEEPLRF